VLVADVDCTAGGESLCQKHQVRGYPTIKIFKKDGNPKGEDYNGPREYQGLKRFVEANLAGPECSLEDKEGCSPEERKILEESEKMSVGARREKIQTLETDIKEKKKQAKALEAEAKPPRCSSSSSAARSPRRWSSCSGMQSSGSIASTARAFGPSCRTSWMAVRPCAMTT